MRIWYKTGLAIFLLVAVSAFLLAAPTWAPVQAQQPTGSIPTVTGTATGPYITVTYQEQINVRAGPHSVYYAAIGVLLPGETAPAIGRSPAGEWIEISYPGVPDGAGWVYAPLVSLSPGFLPIVEPPPTATPRTTPTIDPTMAAALGVNTPTRLPTFTAPPPLEYPTFAPVPGASSSFPIGLAILGLAVLGILGALISVLRGR
jgi:hypothetical protein